MKNKGITLVALVITIIILLILAGISIATLTGSGLFEKAKLAEQKSIEKQEEEQGILGDYENKIGEYVGGNRDGQTNNLTMCSPKLLCNITLPWVTSRNAGLYIASGNSYAKNNSEENFSNYLSFEENTGWKILKDGWYNFNFKFIDSPQVGSDWIEGNLYINDLPILVHNVYVNQSVQDVQGQCYSTTLYLEKDDIVDYEHNIKYVNLQHSAVEIRIYAMSK